jgi:hypothetical protein
MSDMEVPYLPSFSVSTILSLSGGIATLAVLYLMSSVNYLLFFIPLWRSSQSSSGSFIFELIRNSRKYIDNSYFFIIGTRVSEVHGVC